MTQRTQLHAIFGTGPAAAATGSALLDLGYPVRFINRSGESSQILPPGVEIKAANVLDPQQALSAAQGAAVIYNCLNVPYQHWVEVLPSMQSNVLQAAADVGSKYVALENLYMYGPVSGAMDETLPYKAETKKGKLRADMARELVEKHEIGDVKVAIGRASDFYGPGVTNSFLGERTFKPLVRGKAAELVGNPDLPHSYAYIDDVGRGLAALGTHDRAFGEIWHLPHAPAVSSRQMVAIAFQHLNRDPRIRSMGRTMMMLGGLFIPEARESVELLYEFNEPFVVDDSKFRAAFQIEPTPIEVGVENTVEWYQQVYGSA